MWTTEKTEEALMKKRARTVGKFLAQRGEDFVSTSHAKGETWGVSTYEIARGYEQEILSQHYAKAEKVEEGIKKILSWEEFCW